MCVLKEPERWSHLMIPSLICLYWSMDRFLKMLLSVYKTQNRFGYRQLKLTSCCLMSAGTESLEPAACRHLYLLQYLKSYSAVVVLQWRDVIVAESEFSPSVYLKRGGTSVNYWSFWLTLNKVDAQRADLMHLIGVVVSCVVEVMADCRGQHDQQVDAVHLTPQVSQPDQTIHLLRHTETVNNRLETFSC